jgi:hypothetical protein
MNLKKKNHLGEVNYIYIYLVMLGFNQNSILGFNLLFGF